MCCFTVWPQHILISSDFHFSLSTHWTKCIIWMCSLAQGGKMHWQHSDYKFLQLWVVICIATRSMDELVVGKFTSFSRCVCEWPPATPLSLTLRSNSLVVYHSM
jgi:hypothetical protein